MGSAQAPGYEFYSSAPQIVLFMVQNLSSKSREQRLRASRCIFLITLLAVRLQGGFL